MTLLLGSVTDLQLTHCHRHIIVGSHGSRATGALAASYGVASLVCHDAGIGMEEAGVQALDLLDAFTIPAAAIGHMTARIGDPADMLKRGRVTRRNGAAQRLGIELGMSAMEVHQIFCDAPTTAPIEGIQSQSGAAFLRYSLVSINDHEPVRPRVVALDSASSVAPDDEGSIILTGSHGGLPGNTPAKSMRVRPFIAIFNDAGIGIEDAGIRRLAVLDHQNIAAACVHAGSARIGDSRSTYATGVISTANRSALRLGAFVGMTTRELVGITAVKTGKIMQTTFVQQ